ncbi:GFA family protein [Dyella psychrodurans]
MFEGQCLCGAVQYQSTGPALFSVICHCRDCQRASGTGGVPVMGVSRSSFSFRGPAKHSRVCGGSGLPSDRYFCSECGCLLFGMPSAYPDLVSIYVGSLNDSASFSPTDALFIAQRPRWATLSLPLAEHEGLPT